MIDKLKALVAELRLDANKGTVPAFQRDGYRHAAYRLQAIIDEHEKLQAEDYEGRIIQEMVDYEVAKSEQQERVEAER